jgi:SpoVK/Ycf46/Vps4 family AAA+-type ATPase
MSQKFVKSGKKIFPQPNGLIVNLLPGKVYNLMYDGYEEECYLEEDGSLNMPKKIYNSKEDEMFMNRIIRYYKQATNQTTGVLLNGVKGTGKTIMAKQIAIKSELPIVVVNESTPAGAINNFYKKITEETALIFDEIDKDDNSWSENGLLRFLDGVQSTSKKLVLMTSNDKDAMSEYLFDRCSRVRYIRHFEANENVKFIMDILNDLNIKTDHEVIKDFMINNIKLLSIDNMISFLNEVLLFEEDGTLDKNSLSYVLKDMNISKSNDTTNEDIEEDDDENEDEEDDDDDENDDDEEEEPDDSCNRKRLIRLASKCIGCN